MKIQFDSIEEVLEFARRFTVDGAQEHAVRPGNIHADTLANDLGNVGQNGKLAAIKVYRAVTGQGLRESKDAIERHWGKRPMWGG